MAALKLIPVFISCLMLSAHFSRNGDTYTAWAILLYLPALFLIKRKWLVYVLVTLLGYACIEWLLTTFTLSNTRIDHNLPWIRMALILCGVALFSLLSAIVFRNTSLMKQYTSTPQTPLASYLAFILTFILLSIAKAKVSSFPILLADRFLPGSGIFEIVGLSIYAAFITEKLILKGTSKNRSRIWMLFSVVFFTQLALGLGGIYQCLMTGNLHLPVPALIPAGPVYRGHSFFMPVLFLITVALSGPAWCSYFCYLGAWDDRASRILKKPESSSPNNRLYQLIALIIIMLTAILFRYLKVPSVIAVSAGAATGIAGILIMIFISRKKGSMIHCTSFCPVGFLSVTLGKLNPFRIRISSTHCTSCMKCVSACRYQALSEKDVSGLKPSIGCTLCGDCIDSCPHSAMNYSILKKDPSEAARVAFIIIVSVVHAVFLGTARI